MHQQSSEISEATIKQAMRERYDGFGARVAEQVDRLESPDAVWRMAEGEHPALAYYRRRKMETALRLGAFHPGAELLDVGCATGDYTLLFARRGYRMTGADLSSTSIATAAKKAARAGLTDMHFLTADAETLVGVPDASFAGVISFSALRYVPNLPKALEAIRRVLRPAGVAVLDFPNRYCPWFRFLKTKVGVEEHIHDHQYGADEITKLFHRAGLTDVRATHLLFTSYLTPAWALPVFRAADLVGERLPLLRRTAAILMVRGVKP